MTFHRWNTIPREKKRRSQFGGTAVSPIPLRSYAEEDIPRVHPVRTDRLQWLARLGSSAATAE